MGEKEGKGDGKGGKKNAGGGGGGGDGGGAKKDAVVLKFDMHCEGCASKIKRSVKGLEGVEAVTVDLASNKMTVVGKVDPWTLRDRVESKSRKKVDIISPANLPPRPKEKDGGATKDGGGGDAKKPAGDQKKSEDKKPKAPAVSSVVLKIRLHCDGCIQRIQRKIMKVKGVEQVFIDAGKDLVTVKGTMDVKSLPEVLKDKLKRGVEVVPPKKDDGGGGGGGDKKDKGGDGGGKKEGGGGGGEKKEGGGKKEEGGGKADPATTVEANRMEYYGPVGYGYRADMVHPPQMFSDENPNACSVM